MRPATSQAPAAAPSRVLLLTSSMSRVALERHRDREVPHLPAISLS
jgi:hypothetical protein